MAELNHAVLPASTAPAADKVHRRLTLAHPVFSFASDQAQRRLPAAQARRRPCAVHACLALQALPRLRRKCRAGAELACCSCSLRLPLAPDALRSPARYCCTAMVQGQGGVFLAGAWAGYGFHEDGIKSAVDAVQAMGGWRLRIACHAAFTARRADTPCPLRARRRLPAPARLAARLPPGKSPTTLFVFTHIVCLLQAAPSLGCLAPCPPRLAGWTAPPWQRLTSLRAPPCAPAACASSCPAARSWCMATPPRRRHPCLRVGAWVPRQGRAGQGRAGQGRAGQGRAGWAGAPLHGSDAAGRIWQPRCLLTCC